MSKSLIDEQELMEEIVELSEHSSPNRHDYGSLSLEASHYEIVEQLEPPSMENISKQGSSKNSGNSWP